MDFYSEFSDLFNGSLYPSNTHEQGTSSTPAPAPQINDGLVAFNQEQPYYEAHQGVISYDAPAQPVELQQVAANFHDGWNYQESFNYQNLDWQQAAPVQEYIDPSMSANSTGQQGVDVMDPYSLYMPSQEPGFPQLNVSTMIFEAHGMQQANASFLPNSLSNGPSAQQTTTIWNVNQGACGQPYDVNEASAAVDYHHPPIELGSRSGTDKYVSGYDGVLDASGEIAPADDEQQSMAGTDLTSSPEVGTDVTNDDAGDERDPTPTRLEDKSEANQGYRNLAMTCKTTILTETDVLIRELYRSFHHPGRHRSQKLETALIRHGHLEYYLFREDDLLSGHGKTSQGKGVSLSRKAKHPRAKDFVPRDLEENQCYCNDQRDFSQAELMCKECFTWFHKKCLQDVNKEANIVPFMLNYEFTCGFCATKETFRLRKAMKSELYAVTAIANLRHRSLAKGERKEFFSRTNEILPWIERYWVELTGAETRNSARQHSIFKKPLKNEKVFDVWPDEQTERVRRVSKEFPKYALKIRDPRAIRPICGKAIKTVDSAAHLNETLRNIDLEGLPLPKIYRILTEPEPQPPPAVETVAQAVVPIPAPQPAVPPQPPVYLYQQTRPLSRLLVNPRAAPTVAPALPLLAPSTRPHMRYFNNPNQHQQ